MSADKHMEAFFGDISESDLEYFRFLMQTAEILEGVRKSKKITQNEAADLAGVTQAMVSKYESGDYNPSIGKLWEYAHKLGAKLKIHIEIEEKEAPCSIDDNFGFKSSPSNKKASSFCFYDDDWKSVEPAAAA